MFCPGCGLEELQSASQFCRACGNDLRPVRFALERPADNITASAISARDEIGRSIAARIGEMRSAEDLSVVVEDVLPEIEKFLESPEEKRMRRVRKGVVVASIGIGAAIAFFFASLLMGDKGIFMVAGLGFVTFFIGLGLIVNALFFTVPKKTLPADRSDRADSQRRLDSQTTPAAAALNAQTTSDLVLPPIAAASTDVFSSVTEHTTHQLKEKKPIKR